VLGVLRDAARIFSARGARFLGAAVAFYALLSAAPLFVVVLHLASAVFGRGRAEGALWGGLGVWLTPEGVTTVRTLTERLERAEATSSIFGVLLVVYGSTRLFRAVRRALNQLWGIDLEVIEGKRGSAEKYGIRYGGALALVLLVALLVGAIVAIKTAFAFLAAWSTHAPPAVFWAADGITSVGIAFILFAALFRFLPETRVTNREAALSALVSTALFAAGSALVTYYVSHKHIADLYEGASAIVVAVVWVYYSTQVFFLGACVGAALRAREGESSPEKT
jgi:membrane protein